MQHVAAAVWQKQIAEQRLRKEAGSLTLEEVKCLKMVIEQGNNAEKIMARYIEARDKTERNYFFPQLHEWRYSSDGYCSNGQDCENRNKNG